MSFAFISLLIASIVLSCWSPTVVSQGPFSTTHSSSDDSETSNFLDSHEVSPGLLDIDEPGEEPTGEIVDNEAHEHGGFSDPGAAVSYLEQLRAEYGPWDNPDSFVRKKRSAANDEYPMNFLSALSSNLVGQDADYLLSMFNNLQSHSAAPTVEKTEPAKDTSSRHGGGRRLEHPMHLSGYHPMPIEQMQPEMKSKLKKLDYYFENLEIGDEECRRRIMCEVAQDPPRFSPLTDVLVDETNQLRGFKQVTSNLLGSLEGSRLLSYIEATFRGLDRGRSCDIYQYRCPRRTEEMINYEALQIWKEVNKWLTVKVLSRHDMKSRH